MNAKRKKKNFSFSELVLLAIAAIILATGGVMHAYAKNQHVEIARKVDAAKSQITELDEDTALLQVKMERKLGRHRIKERLNDSKSDLRASKPHQIEHVILNAEGTASASNP